MFTKEQPPSSWASLSCALNGIAYICMSSWKVMEQNLHEFVKNYFGHPFDSTSGLIVPLNMVRAYYYYQTYV